jgi:hypothetical protein
MWWWRRWGPSTSSARMRWRRGWSGGARQWILNQIQMISIELKSNSYSFKFDLIQKRFSQYNFYEIKYGCEGFDVRNNFSYRNFFRFEMDLELKIRENSRV